MAKKVLLSVLAHPDDETFGMGGTLATYARRDVDVYLICATRGEVGEMDPALLRGFNSIAERREAELRCAAEKLGLKDVIFLDYRNSGMPGSPDNTHPQALAAQPLQAVAERVAHFIRLLKPQVVLTFDPIGGYGHPDHIAIQRATELAFKLAGDPTVLPDDLPPFAPQKLYFHTMSRTFLRWMVRLMPLMGKDPRKFGKNGDIDLAWIAGVDFPTHAKIEYTAVAQIRDEASACHASQGGGSMSTGWYAKIRRWFAAYETFMRVAPPPQNKRIERDLFEGVAE